MHSAAAPVCKRFSDPLCTGLQRPGLEGAQPGTLASPGLRQRPSWAPEVVAC